MKIGFVILNYNSWRMTSDLAWEVASYKNIDAVVVVDNDSSEDHQEYLKRLYHKKIHMVRSGKNGGYSYGNNCGAKICKDMGMEIAFFANPDVLVKEEDIQKILDQFMKTDYPILSCVEYIRPGEMAQPPLSRRRDYWDDLIDCFFLGRKFGGKTLGMGLDKNVAVQRVEMVKGSFFAVRLDDLIEMGGFDERVFLYCEERILSKRAEDLGKKMGIVTDAGYIHTHSASIQKECKKAGDRIKMLYTSRAYYHKTYTKIKGMKYRLLLSAMKISVLEYRIRDIIRMKRRTEEADG